MNNIEHVEEYIGEYKNTRIQLDTVYLVGLVNLSLAPIHSTNLTRQLTFSCSSIVTQRYFICDNFSTFSPSIYNWFSTCVCFFLTNYQKFSFLRFILSLLCCSHVGSLLKRSGNMAFVSAPYYLWCIYLHRWLIGWEYFFNLILHSINETQTNLIS